MSSKYIHASISPPRRVQILKADRSGGYWKPGQFGYATAYSTHPDMHTLDKGPSAPDELTFLVSKSKDAKGGALWFSAEALRFTKLPTELEQLTDVERVALDALMQSGNGQARELVPDDERRGQLKATAAQLRSLRSRSRG